MRVKSSKNKNFILNGNQASVYIKEKNRLSRPFVRTVMVSVTFQGQYFRILEL